MEGRGEGERGEKGLARENNGHGLDLCGMRRSLATAAVYAVARAAYAAAVAARPGAPVSLRLGIRVLDATFEGA